MKEIFGVGAIHELPLRSTEPKLAFLNLLLSVIVKRILRTGYSKIKLLLYVDAHKAYIVVVKCNFLK